MNVAAIDSNSAVTARPAGLHLGRTRSILLVDDDPAIRRMLIAALASENYVVLPAANGVEAIWLASAINPDLVLLDLNMPLKGGWETIEWLTANKPRLPVVIITAEPGQQGRVANAGITEFMEKPLDLPVLMERIHGLLAGQYAGKTTDRRNGLNESATVTN